MEILIILLHDPIVLFLFGIVITLLVALCQSYGFKTIGQVLTAIKNANIFAVATCIFVALIVIRSIALSF